MLGVRIFATISTSDRRSFTVPTVRSQSATAAEVAEVVVGGQDDLPLPPGRVVGVPGSSLLGFREPNQRRVYQQRRLLTEYYSGSQGC